MTNNGCDQLGDNGPDDTLIWMPMAGDTLVTSATNASGLVNFGFPYCHWCASGLSRRTAYFGGPRYTLGVYLECMTAQRVGELH